MNMITKEQLHAMIPLATEDDIDKYLKPLNDAMDLFEINTPMRISAFIAQLAHESVNLHYVEEISKGSAYEYRKDLGNLKPEALEVAHANHSTTGKFFKGHGLIQITGYDNHLACGNALGIDCVTNPRILCEPEYATKSAAWFWHEHGLNKHADTGNFGRITRMINGGTKGAEQRLALYWNCKKVLCSEKSSTGLA